jgi:hypothetical protein
VVLDTFPEVATAGEREEAIVLLEANRVEE